MSLHLYNNTFLEVHTNTHKNNRSIALNNIITANPHKSLFFTLFGYPDGELIYSSSSLDSAIADLGGMNKVLQKIIDSDTSSAPLYVYCDYAGYLRLACAWLKTTIPGLTQQAFSDIIIRDSASKNFISRHFTYDSMKSLELPQRDKTKIASDLANAAALKEELNNLSAVWSSTNAVSGVTYNPASLSFEFQYARYLKDGNSWSGAATFKSAIVDFIVNVVVSDINEEFRSMLLQNMFVLPSLPEFSGFDPLNDDLKTWMGPTHPFAFLTDVNFRVNNLAYVKANYNLAQIGELYNKYTNQPYHLDMAFYLSGASYEEIMEHEFNEKFGLRYFGVEQDTLRTSNMYLFYFINKLSKNNPARLVEFSV